MPIADDWDFNYANKVISHIDGILSYNTGTGTQPAVGQYVRGATSGATGKVLSRTGTVTSGTLTLTNVIGRFESGEQLDTLSELNFDGVANGGFQVGDTLQGATSSQTIDVLFIEYNLGATAGAGTIYGNNMSGLFTDNENLDIVGGTAGVANADGTGTDNDIAFDATTTTALTVPGTANTNNSIILHYDAGTIDIPVDAHVADAVTGAEGFVQRVYGATTQGSLRIIDSDTTGGAWTNNNNLQIEDVVFYDNLVVGSVFSEGDVVRGSSSGATGRVLAIIDDGDSTGKLILANFSGTFVNADDLEVLQSDDTYVKVAEVEDSQPIVLTAAVINTPGGVRDEQRTDQGGIYPAGSLNIVRKSNALYSLCQDLFDELGQLDDDPALDGNVRDQLYTILNDYVIPDLSFRFLDRGSFRDTANNNVFTNYVTTGAIADIGDHGFLYDASNPTPQPDMYVEQNGVVLRQDWLEGNLDILIKVKTSTDPFYINPSVEALGQVIDNADVTVHLRPYTRTYDSNEVRQQGGIAVVALGNAVDLNNTTGQYRAAFTGGSGTPFTVGEIATTSDGKRVQITASDTGATGNVDYALKTGANLINTDVITGEVSGATATVGTPTNLVAGYSTDIRVMVVQRRFTGGTTTGTYVLGELITQAVSGATGYFMEDDSGTIYIEEASGTFNATGQLTGGTSGATNTPTGTAAFSTVPKDIGGGVGDKNYTGVTSADITGANAQPVLNVYEWWKFLTRKESTEGVKLAGLLFSDTIEGRIYRRLQDTFAEVRGASPFGTKAGDLVIGAQGMFIEKDTLAVADLRNIQLIDNLGDTYDPPNLQAMSLVNIFAGVRGAIFRSTGSGSETILRAEFDVGTVGGGNNQAADSTILVGANTRTVSPLPSDVPDTGYLYVLDPNDTGNYLEFVYDSVNRTTNIFSLQQGIGQNTIGDVTGGADLTLDDNAHVVFIREQAAGTSLTQTVQYIGDVDLVAVARIKGKKPFKAPAVFGSGGVSVGVVLNQDEVVNLP